MRTHTWTHMKIFVFYSCIRLSAMDLFFSCMRENIHNKNVTYTFKQKYSILCICTRPKKILSNLYSHISLCWCFVFLFFFSLFFFIWSFLHSLVDVVPPYSIVLYTIINMLYRVYRLGHRQKINFSLNFSPKNSHTMRSAEFIRASFHAYSQPIKRKFH